MDTIRSSIIDMIMSSSAITMAMMAISMVAMEAMVAVVDIVGAVAMAVETLKEITLIMDLEPIRFVKYVARHVTLR
jgi:hypothetical protein